MLLRRKIALRKQVPCLCHTTGHISFHVTTKYLAEASRKINRFCTVFVVRQNVVVAFKYIDKLIALIKTPSLPQITRPRTEKIKENVERQQTQICYTPQKGKKLWRLTRKGCLKIAHFGDKYRNNYMN